MKHAVGSSKLLFSVIMAKNCADVDAESASDVRITIMLFGVHYFVSCPATDANSCRPAPDEIVSQLLVLSMILAKCNVDIATDSDTDTFAGIK